MDTETVNKAVEITSEKINKRLLNNIPKTAAGFEADFSSLKKDMITFYSYLRHIPVENISQLFLKVEMSSELFSAILKVLAEQGVIGDEEALVHAGKLISSLGKCSNFDMTLMFMDSKEKKDLVTIVQTLKKSSVVDKEVLKQLDSIYKL